MIIYLLMIVVFVLFLANVVDDNPSTFKIYPEWLVAFVVVTMSVLWPVTLACTLIRNAFMHLKRRGKKS